MKHVYPTSVKQILKAIGCPHLELVDGNGYWYFVYDNQEAGVYETENMTVLRLKHLYLHLWLEYGNDFVKRMDAVVAEKLADRKFVPPSDPIEILKALETQNEKICATDSLYYVNKHEAQEIQNLRDDIERGQEALRRAQRYLEWMQTQPYDRNVFADFHYLKERQLKAAPK